MKCIDEFATKVQFLMVDAANVANCLRCISECQ
jgi:hypothetical protein